MHTYMCVCVCMRVTLCNLSLSSLSLDSGGGLEKVTLGWGCSAFVILWRRRLSILLMHCRRLCELCHM